MCAGVRLSVSFGCVWYLLPERVASLLLRPVRFSGDDGHMTNWIVRNTARFVAAAVLGLAGVYVLSFLLGQLLLQLLWGAL
jgi:hypothetical protein